jgi:hypothetical protein
MAVEAGIKALRVGDSVCHNGMNLQPPQKYKTLLLTHDIHTARDCVCVYSLLDPIEGSLIINFPYQGPLSKMCAQQNREWVQRRPEPPNQRRDSPGSTLTQETDQNELSSLYRLPYPAETLWAAAASTRTKPNSSTGGRSDAAMDDRTVSSASAAATPYSDRAQSRPDLAEREYWLRMLLPALPVSMDTTTMSAAAEQYQQLTIDGVPASRSTLARDGGGRRLADLLGFDESASTRRVRVECVLRDADRVFSRPQREEHRCHHERRAGRAGGGGAQDPRSRPTGTSAWMVERRSEGGEADGEVEGRIG